MYLSSVENAADQLASSERRRRERERTLAELELIVHLEALLVHCDSGRLRYKRRR